MTVDSEGANHQVEYRSLINWNTFISIKIPSAYEFNSLKIYDLIDFLNV